jgi:hypothetical protein
MRKSQPTKLIFIPKKMTPPPHKKFMPIRKIFRKIFIILQKELTPTLITMFHSSHKYHHYK